LALRNEADAICEKPLVLNPWNIDGLELMEQETGRKIYTILQLRYHPVIQELKKQVAELPTGKISDIDLAYVTSRGAWYLWSWKGNVYKSGGVATNIGIHFFDMLTWIFGKKTRSTVHVSTERRAAGLLELERANVRWFLSIDSEDLPNSSREKGSRAFRSLKMAGREIEFSDGFTDLHTVSYQQILSGNGYGPAQARSSIEIAHDIREATPIGLKGDYHPALKS
jgi:UDP-N-acetyl-2-amino-2-deoxyglucuronate dehydrogenase